MRRTVTMSAVVALALYLVSAVLGATAARAEDSVNPGGQNGALAADGIHDPTLEGARLLQSPTEAFAGFPPANGGNRVNWTEALRSGKITPRFDKTGKEPKPAVFNLDIVRGVGRYTPPAVFPHATHSEWVDCPVCHPALFVAKKGANSMTMAEIMLGQKCGVCHGTVAFPASECRRCHYQITTPAAKTASANTTSVKSIPRSPNGKKRARLRR